MTATQGERAVHLASEMGLPPEDPAWTARRTAFDALARLGHSALGRDDALAAEGLLSRALRLAESDGFGAAVLMPVRVAHAEALAFLSRLDEAEAELEGALDAPEHAVQARLVLGSVRRRRGDLRGSRQALVAALAAASDRGDERRAAEALRALGLLDYFEGRFRDAERHIEQARVLAEQVGDRRGVGWALQHLAWSATTRGDYELAMDALRQAEEHFAALEDTAGLSWVAGTEGFVRLLQGRFAEARDLAASVLPLGEQKGDRWGVAAALTIDAMAAAEQGDVVVAADEAERARARFAETGDAWGQALALVAAGAAARGADLPERAVAFLTEAVDLSERGHHPVTAALALVALGYAYLDQDRLDDAESCVLSVSVALGGLDLEPHAALGARVLHAQVLRRRGEPGRALAELDAALATSKEEPGLLFPRRQALAHRAGTLLDLGRPVEALETAHEAVATAAEDVRSEVVALRVLGSALRATGDTAGGRAALERALAAARSTGQTSEVAATEALLATP